MTLLHYFFDLTSFYRLGQKHKNIFDCFLVQMETLKSPFKINWPLEAWSIFTFGMPCSGQNLTNSKSYLVLRSVICPLVICQKIAIFEQLNNQILFRLKIEFDPSVETSWCDIFKIIKGHGPKNPPKVCSWCPLKL